MDHDMEDRRKLRCATPSCRYLVNPNPLFGGFCCFKCHWVHDSGSTKCRKKHGIHCCRHDAPHDAVVSPAVPPHIAALDRGAGTSPDIAPEAAAPPARSDHTQLAPRPGWTASETPSSRPKGDSEGGDADGAPVQKLRRRLPMEGETGAAAVADVAAVPKSSSGGSQGNKVHLPLPAGSGSNSAAAGVPFTRSVPGPDHVVGQVGSARLLLIQVGKLTGTSYGTTTFKLWDVWTTDGGRMDQGILVIWLHGAAMDDIDHMHLVKVQQRLQRHVYFLVPTNPRQGPGGLKFQWGCSFTEEQNEKELGFVFGEMHTPFLTDLVKLVQTLAHETKTSHTIVMGYSMGGFGVYQLAAHAPESFSIAIAVAGYGMGTYAGEDAASWYGAPQPRSSEILDGYIRHFARHMARVKKFFVVHSKADTISVFQDVHAIANNILKCGGTVQSLLVPDENADSDQKKHRKAKKRGHGYFNYTFVTQDSQDFLWPHIRSALESIPGREIQHPAIGSGQELKCPA